MKRISQLVPGGVISKSLSQLFYSRGHGSNNPLRLQRIKDQELGYITILRKTISTFIGA